MSPHRANPPAQYRHPRRWSTSGEVGNLAAFALAGLACSAFLPLSISLATSDFRRRAELLSGGMMAAYLLGFGLGAYGVGPLRERGVALGTIYPAAGVFAAGLAILVVLVTRDRRPSLSGGVYPRPSGPAGPQLHRRSSQLRITGGGKPRPYVHVHASPSFETVSLSPPASRDRRGLAAARSQ